MPTGSQTASIARRERLFSKVKEARELLKQEAETILRSYMQTIQMAVAAGQYEAALKAQQWLIEHFPEDEGVKMIDISVDRPKQVEGQSGPAIQIGIALGGMVQPKRLEVPTIEAEVIQNEPDRDQDA
jgi:hypothetical protein